MKYIKVSIIFIVAMLVVLTCDLIFPQHVAAQYKVPNSVFGIGGGAMSNSSYQITGTAGQPVIGFVQSSSNNQYAGFWYTIIERVTSGVNPVDALPTEYRLEQNYPNPFNPSTVIEYALPEASQVRIVVYNVFGEEVATLFDGEEVAGYYKLSWHPESLASGVYFYRLTAKGKSSNRAFSDVKKLVYVR